MFNMREQFAQEYDVLRTQSLKIKANLDLTLLQKRGLEGELSIFRENYEEILQSKTRIEQDLIKEQSRIAELEQAYSQLQEKQEEQSR